VTTRPPFFPAATSAATICLMKLVGALASDGFSEDVMALPRFVAW